MTAPRRGNAALAVYTLCRREVVRFVRQRSRLVGALGQPLLFWILLGGGLKGSFFPAGEGAGTGSVQYLYPGILALTLLFTAIFSTISVVEDRRAGFLQGVLVAPVPRWSIVAGQASGSTLLAVVQGTLLLALSPAAGLRIAAAGVAASIGVMALLAFALSSLGLTLAWRMESTQGFHAIMNLVLMPMWLLSGALFPQAGATSWLAWVMWLNPMTYGMAALRASLALGGAAATVAGVGSVAPGGPAAGPGVGPGLGIVASLGIVALAGLLAFAAAVRLARRATV